MKLVIWPFWTKIGPLSTTIGPFACIFQPEHPHICAWHSIGQLNQNFYPLVTNTPLVLLKMGVFGPFWTKLCPLNQTTGTFAHLFQPDHPDICGCTLLRQWHQQIIHKWLKTVCLPYWTKIGPLSQTFGPIAYIFQQKHPSHMWLTPKKTMHENFYPIVINGPLVLVKTFFE